MEERDVFTPLRDRGNRNTVAGAGGPGTPSRRRASYVVIRRMSDGISSFTRAAVNKIPTKEKKRLSPFPSNPKSCEIKLDFFDDCSLEPIYRAGQIIKGKVCFTLSEPISFKKLFVRFHGLSKVWWLEGTGDQRREYQNLDTYFNDVIVLSQAEKEDSMTEFSAGDYQFKFQYRLPNNLPCSVERVGAYTRYSIKTVIDRSWAALNPSWKRPFTVIDDVDLNEIPNVLTSSSYFKNKRILRGFCGAGNFKMRAFTDRYGYCPGETIYITVSCINNSAFIIRKVIVSLQQLVMYTSSTGHRKCQWNNLLTVNKEGCPRRGGKILITDFPMHIPSIPMTCTANKCRCISTSYSVKVKFWTRKWISYAFDLPIIIGSIPINLFASLNSGIIHPPPTHLECVMKGGTLDDEDDVMATEDQLSSFTPAYTYYDWNGNYPKPENLPYSVTGRKLLEY